MALVRKLISGSITTGGTANAHTFATGFSMSAYQQDMPMAFEAGNTNTASATMNVDSIGTKTMIRGDGQTLLPGDIVAGGVYWMTYEAGADKIVLHNPSNQRSVVGVNPQTDNYTLAIADAGKVVTMSHSSSKTVTIPANASVGFVIGTVIAIQQIGTGTTSVAGDTGVTLNGASAGSGALLSRYSSVAIVKTATNTWLMSGAHGTVS